jgi:hypothetical protein
MTTTPFDLTDLAYFAMGVAESLRSEPPINPDDWNGESGFVGACMELAQALEVPCLDDFAEHFAYEVAQPLGRWVADHMKQTAGSQCFRRWAGQVSAAAAVDGELRRLIRLGSV